TWSGPRPGGWSSSLDHAGYVAAVEHVRQAVRAGDVYQANVYRVLSAPLAGHGAAEPSAAALSAVLAAGNPAPYAGG
ncbi:hypothetical protein, partial [Mammaliicoccus sciuri]|uniref:hypothetical protein n=1 Tax=Mammaliicoccus sciuri TaxID=1296 RepID=UPI002896CBEA